MFEPARAAGPRRCSRSTSAGWAHAGATSTTPSSPRQGYADEAELVQDLYLDGRKEEAAAALPDELHRPGHADRPARLRAGADRRAARGRGHPPARQPGQRRTSQKLLAQVQGVDRRDPPALTITLGHPDHTLPVTVARHGRERALLDLAIAVSDRPVTSTSTATSRRTRGGWAPSGRTSTSPSTGCGSGSRRARSATWLLERELTGAPAVAHRLGRGGRRRRLRPARRGPDRPVRRPVRASSTRPADAAASSTSFEAALHCARRRPPRRAAGSRRRRSSSQRLPRDPAALLDRLRRGQPRAAGSARSPPPSPRCAPGWCPADAALRALPGADRAARRERRRATCSTSTGSDVPRARARRRPHPHRADDRPARRPVRR